MPNDLSANNVQGVQHQEPQKKNESSQTMIENENLNNGVEIRFSNDYDDNTRSSSLPSKTAKENASIDGITLRKRIFSKGAVVMNSIKAFTSNHELKENIDFRKWSKRLIHVSSLMLALITLYLLYVFGIWAFPISFMKAVINFLTTGSVGNIYPNIGKSGITGSGVTTPKNTYDNWLNVSLTNHKSLKLCTSVSSWSLDGNWKLEKIPRQQSSSMVQYVQDEREMETLLANKQRLELERELRPLLKKFSLVTEEEDIDSSLSKKVSQEDKTSSQKSSATNYQWLYSSLNYVFYLDSKEKNDKISSQTNDNEGDEWEYYDDDNEEDYDDNDNEEEENDNSDVEEDYTHQQLQIESQEQRLKSIYYKVDTSARNNNDNSNNVPQIGGTFVSVWSIILKMIYDAKDDERVMSGGFLCTYMFNRWPHFMQPMPCLCIVDKTKFPTIHMFNMENPKALPLIINPTRDCDLESDKRLESVRVVSDDLYFDTFSSSRAEGFEKRRIVRNIPKQYPLFHETLFVPDTFSSSKPKSGVSKSINARAMIQHYYLTHNLMDASNVFLFPDEIDRLMNMETLFYINQDNVVDNPRIKNLKIKWLESKKSPSSPTEIVVPTDITGGNKNMISNPIDDGATKPKEQLIQPSNQNQQQQRRKKKKTTAPSTSNKHNPSQNSMFFKEEEEDEDEQQYDRQPQQQQQQKQGSRKKQRRNS